MLGISDANIVAEGEPDSSYESHSDGVELRYNRTDPGLVRDGVDVIVVTPAAADRYRIEYRGYLTGSLDVTSAGAAELGESLLGDRDDVPSWVVTSAPDRLPDWIPADYESPSPVRCERCDEPTEVTDVYTVGELETVRIDVCCSECWPEVQEESRRQGRDERAAALRESATDDPESVDVEVILDLLDAESDEARIHALSALREVIGARPGDTVEAVPRLEALLDSDSDAVRTASVGCLAAFAETHPGHVTPVADDVVTDVRADAPAERLENAVQYVAAIADHDPRAVLDAVPKLGALLQDDPPNEQQVLVALIHIGAAYPDEVVPIASDLRAYVETEDGPHRVAAIAALGNVTKSYPNVSESTAETLIGLLDAENPMLRANAAGLLADIAAEYPEAVRPAVPRAIELLDDSDEKARYNATSILSRVADASPGAVERAIDPLVDVLDDDFAYTRSNACWALGYLEAEAALESLADLERTDPDEEVRDVAGWAIEQIRDTDGTVGDEPT